jgi:hypothetical protein
MTTPYTKPVLDWFSRYARDLPWRGPGTTPWSVLVSEIMLQQTPVARVVPAHQSWLARCPPPWPPSRPTSRSGSGADSGTPGAPCGCTRRLPS